MKFIFLLPILFLLGCSSEKIHDMKLTALSPVCRAQQPEFVQKEGFDSSIVKKHGPNADNEKVLKVEFSTKSDLSHSHHSSFWGLTHWGVNAFICEKPNARILLKASGLYYSQKSIEAAEGEAKDSQAPVTYYFFIRGQDEGGNDMPNIEAFDLTSHPQDVCFELTEWLYSPNRYRSNKVTIPAEKVSSVLSEKTNCP